MHGRRVQQEKAQLDNVEDKVEEHVHRQEDARDAFRGWNVRFEMYPDLFGSPDFQVGKRVLVFCDGDFWHGYRYAEKKRPAKKYWREKIEGNMRRDRKVSRKAAQRRMVGSQNMGARHQKKPRQVHEKDNAEATSKIMLLRI